METVSESEQALVDAARSGCIDSFGDLYRRHHSSMVAIAWGILGDLHLAEDASQQTFAIACEKMNTLRRADRFPWWLARICRNVSRDIRRRSRKVTVLKDDIAVVHEAGGEDADQVRRVVWKLKPSLKEPLVMKYYDNLSYQQIANVLGVSVATVNGRIFRAKKIVGAQLKKMGLQEVCHETF